MPFLIWHPQHGSFYFSWHYLAVSHTSSSIFPTQGLCTYCSIGLKSTHQVTVHLTLSSLPGLTSKHCVFNQTCSAHLLTIITLFPSWSSHHTLSLLYYFFRIAPITLWRWYIWLVCSLQLCPHWNDSSARVGVFVIWNTTESVTSEVSQACAELQSPANAQSTCAKTSAIVI